MELLDVPTGFAAASTLPQWPGAEAAGSRGALGWSQTASGLLGRASVISTTFPRVTCSVAGVTRHSFLPLKTQCFAYHRLMGVQAFSSSWLEQGTLQAREGTRLCEDAVFTRLGTYCE